MAAHAAMHSTSAAWAEARPLERSEPDGEGKHHITAEGVVPSILDIVVCSRPVKILALVENVVDLQLKSAHSLKQCLGDGRVDYESRVAVGCYISLVERVVRICNESP
jgi:hypothetical protein